MSTTRTQPDDTDTPIATYRGQAIYALPTYSTPYYFWHGATIYYPRVKRFGGRANHSMRLRAIERQIDQYLAAFDASEAARAASKGGR